jgi:polygalacturonase
MGTGLASIVSAACAGPAVLQTVRDFGAKGDGVTDDAPAIQRAIDAAARAGGGTVTLAPGTYLIHYRTSEDGDGVSGLTMRSGVTLEGTDRAQCILKLADGQMGQNTYARLIASRGEIVGAAFRNFTIDGNRSRQFGERDNISGAGILLGWKSRCADITVELLHVHDMIGQGVLLQGAIGNVARRLRMAGNRIERTTYIGLQASQFDGVEIVDNQVFDCRDNGIDIYGDDTAGHSTVATSHNATIARNEIRRCSIGVFLETVADSSAIDNRIMDCRGAGVRINRIHGEPRNLTVADNRIAGTPVGVAVGGDTGGVKIEANDIAGFTRAGIDLSYNVSRIDVTGNRFRPANGNVPIVLANPTTVDTPPQRLTFLRIQDNHVPRGHTRLFDNRYRSLFRVDVDRFIADLE